MTLIYFTIAKACGERNEPSCSQTGVVLFTARSQILRYPLKIVPLWWNWSFCSEVIHDCPAIYV